MRTFNVIDEKSGGLIVIQRHYHISVFYNYYYSRVIRYS